MSVFALPALIALFTKFGVYSLARKNQHASQTFLMLLIFFGMHNLSEFLVISELLNNQVSENLLRSYYVAALFSVAYMCVFTMSVVNKGSHNKFNFFVLSIAFLISLVIFFSDLVIAGAVSVGYTVTAIKGAYYFVFQLAAVLGFSWIITTLVTRYLSTLDVQVQLKCFYAMFALFPVIVMSIFVIAMMQFGYQYTGAILLPFSSTFFLLIIVLTEKDNDFIRIRHRLPFSKQRAAEKKLLSIYRSHTDGDIGLADTKTAIERLLIQNALEHTNNNVSQTANNLGIKRSTLYSVMNRLEMKRDATIDS